MEAGRELDALIAEKVMGYTKRLVPANSLPNVDCPKYTFPREDGWLFTNSGGYDDYYMGHVNDMFVSRSRGFPETLRGIPPYSEDLVAAWEVVRAMTEKRAGSDEDTGYSFHMNSYDSMPHLFDISFDHLDGCPANTQKCSVDNIPEAICAAALKAVEGR